MKKGRVFKNIVFFRFLRAGITPAWLVNPPIGNIGMALVAYCFSYQFCAYAVIALNRYSAIANRWTEVPLRGNGKMASAAVYNLAVARAICPPCVRVVGSDSVAEHHSKASQSTGSSATLDRHVRSSLPANLGLSGNCLLFSEKFHVSRRLLA